MEINAYSTVSPHYTGTDAAAKTAESDSTLGMDEFLQLLAAQLANQDMMNPSSDTEFIAQLAQFSSLQAMDSMAKMTNLSQSTDLIGKTVIVAEFDANNVLKYIEGEVDRVILAGDDPTLVINGKEYTYSNVMEIVATNTESSESSLSQMTALIGKNVAVSDTAEDGTEMRIEGVVEKVVLTGESDEPKLVINGKEYSYSSVIEVIPEDVEAEETVPEDTTTEETP